MRCGRCWGELDDKKIRLTEITVSTANATAKGLKNRIFSPGQGRAGFRRRLRPSSEPIRSMPNNRARGVGWEIIGPYRMGVRQRRAEKLVPASGSCQIDEIEFIVAVGVCARRPPNRAIRHVSVPTSSRQNPRKPTRSNELIHTGGIRCCPCPSAGGPCSIFQLLRSKCSTIAPAILYCSSTVSARRIPRTRRRPCRRPITTERRSSSALLHVGGDDGTKRNRCHGRAQSQGRVCELVHTRVT
jgi:hypothetical protein